MTDLSFSPLVSLPILSIITVVITLLFLSLEVKRKSSYLPLRLLAVVLMMGSILLLALKPSYLSSRTSSGYLLLTDNYTESKVDSLLNIHPSLQCIHLEKTKPYHNSRLLKPYELTEINSSIRFILGDGLPLPMLDLLTNKSIVYLPGEKRMGIQALHVPNPITANEKNFIQGVLTSDTPVQLRLLGPGGVEDSVTITEKKSSFSLAFKPLSVGKFLYTIAWSAKDQSVQEKLPLEVLPARKLNTLFLQAAPGIEIRMLKSYLAEGGHSISARYQLSKEKYRYEYVNSPNINLSALTVDILKKFDLVILENATFTTLTQREQKSLEQAVKEGLGLLVLLNSVPAKQDVLYRFINVQKRNTEEDTISLVLVDQKKFKLKVGPLLAAEQPYLVSHLQKGSTVYAGHVPFSFGKVGFQILDETYRLSLEGEKEAYAACWTSLLKSTSRKNKTGSSLQLENEFPIYPNDALHFKILYESTPRLTSRGIVVPVQEDAYVDHVWSGQIWADPMGWHHIENVSDSTSLHYYVSDLEEWKSLRVQKQKQELLKRMTNQEAQTQHQQANRKEVPSWIFFLTFLLSAAFLWLAPKL